MGRRLWQAETRRIPKAVRNRYRGITQPEWEAVQRLVVLIFSALEKDTQAKHRSSGRPEDFSPRPGVWTF
jgi:hypothetical protein